MAVAVIERLQLEFRDQVILEPYLWERSILRATDSFQNQIVDIREVDLALFILWSRIGTPLPLSEFARPDGSQYMSGTEYEFERAREAYQEKSSPEILCYVKTAEIRFSLKDREERARRNAELDGVGAFVDRWFRNPDGTFKSAFYSFEKPAQFEEAVEIHLRDWIRDKLRARQGGRVGRTVWQGSPFRGLQVFDFEHSLIYCGRTQTVAEALETLRRRASAQRPFIMVTGMSGVGKSSLVRAGLLPLLTRPSVIEGVIGWRRAVFRPNVGHQGLLESLAAALVAKEALPHLGEVGRVRQLLTDPAALTGAVGQALDAATLRAREARPDPDTEGTVRLVVVVDQFEEIFDETVSAEERDAFAEALRTLMLTGRVWGIATLRADFFSRCAHLPERFRDLFIEGGGIFTLGGPRPAEIAQMIRRPAMMAGLEFERRGEPEEGLDDVLRDAAAGNPTVLPLLEFTLDELWRRSGGAGVLRFQDYEQIGGIHGALRLRADEELAKLPPAVQASLPEVLAAIVHTDPTDDRLIIQNRVPARQFDRRPGCRQLVDAFVAAHLLVADQASDGEPVIALAHEALLREWPPAVRWIESNRELLRLRAGISAAAALWRNSGRREGRLLTGELLADASRLLKANGSALAPEERAYVQLSAREARRLRTARIRRGALAAAAVLLAVSVPVIGLGQLAYGAAVAWAVPRVWGEAAGIPVSAETRSNLRASIANLAEVLREDVERQAELGPWSMAQMRAALHGLPQAGPDGGRALRAYITAARDPRCSCWRETPVKPPNEMASAWVLLSLAIHRERADAEEISSALARQNKSGWWPIFPVLPVDRNASTAVTALMLLALKRHLDEGLLRPDQEAQVEEAIVGGVAWLRALSSGHARWPPYPPPPVGIWEHGEYPGTSALVTHVLRTVTGARDLDGPWLERLPKDIPAVRANEIPKANLRATERDVEIDDSRTYRFPWMLLATAEAFAGGTPIQRARALIWIEGALKAPLTRADFGSESWIVGEVLFALRQVERTADGASPGPRPGAEALARRFQMRPTE